MKRLSTVVAGSAVAAFAAIVAIVAVVAPGALGRSSAPLAAERGEYGGGIYPDLALTISAGPAGVRVGGTRHDDEQDDDHDPQGSETGGQADPAEAEA